MSTHTEHRRDRDTAVCTAVHTTTTTSSTAAVPGNTSSSKYIRVLGEVCVCVHTPRPYSSTVFLTESKAIAIKINYLHVLTCQLQVGRKFHEDFKT